jgi:hypothetical protein
MASMMDLRTQLITVADVFGRHTGRGRKRVSTIVLNQGNRLDEFASGRLSPTVRVFERAMLWFSANWPAEANWPADIARPSAVLEKSDA